MPLARLEVSPCTRVMSTYDCYIFLMKVSSTKSAQSVSSNIYLFYLSCLHLFELHIFFLYINIICIFYFSLLVENYIISHEFGFNFSYYFFHKFYVFR